MKRVLLLLTATLLTVCLTTAFAAEKKKDPLAAWKPKFDPSGAKYTYILSIFRTRLLKALPSVTGFATPSGKNPRARSMSTTVRWHSSVVKRTSLPSSSSVPSMAC